jgi:hypothetical protein
MDRGYVKLWRKTLDSGWFKNHKLWVFWSYCLVKATHKEITQMVGFQQVSLAPGEFIFGRKKAAKDLNMSEKEIRTCVKNLDKLGNVAIKRANKFSIITIINWDTYQCDEQEKGHQKGHVRAIKGPAEGHKQEHNHIRTKEINIYTSDFLSFWHAYPSKTGKGEAWKSWNKNGRPPLDIILQAIETQKKGRRWIEGYIPNPSTWLNQKRWEDEISTQGPQEGELTKWMRENS